MLSWWLELLKILKIKLKGDLGVNSGAWSCGIDSLGETLVFFGMKSWDIWQKGCSL